MMFDFSTLAIPTSHPSTKDPTDFSDPVYDEAVKKAVRAIDEARALGWHSTTVAAPNVEISDRLESLLLHYAKNAYGINPGQYANLTYTRTGKDNRKFELEWDDADDNVNGENTELMFRDIDLASASQEEMLLIQTLMEDFGF